MKIYLKNRSGNVNASAIYNEKDGSVTVCKGSVISQGVSGGTFRSANSVSKLRADKKIVNGIDVISDITFKSASAAANFVTGTSTNGLLSWKNEEGVALKKLIGE